MKYKLYKAGKFIVTAGVILGTALTFSQVSASANTEKLPSEGMTMQTPNSTAVQPCLLQLINLKAVAQKPK